MKFAFVFYDPSAPFSPQWLGLSNDATAMMLRAGEWSHGPYGASQRGFVTEAQLKAFAQVSEKRFAIVLQEVLQGGPAALLYATEGGFLFSYGGTAKIDQGRREVLPALRTAVIARCGLVCGICKELVRAEDVEIDHIVPWSKGGPTTLLNLQVTHALCNRRKGAQLL